jgi:mersacidin/lichenicidin family type 2 lantibiotic
MNIVPTWKNATSRQSLTAETQALLPTKLVGEVELTDADLEGIHGGNSSGILTDDLSHNHINVLNGTNTLLNNVGILGVGSSNCASETSGDSCYYSDQGCDYGYRHRC